jgi:hypothetical protein
LTHQSHRGFPRQNLRLQWHCVCRTRHETRGQPRQNIIHQHVALLKHRFNARLEGRTVAGGVISHAQTAQKKFRHPQILSVGHRNDHPQDSIKKHLDTNIPEPTSKVINQCGKNCKKYVNNIEELLLEVKPPLGNSKRDDGESKDNSFALKKLVFINAFVNLGCLIFSWFNDNIIYKRQVDVDLINIINSFSDYEFLLKTGTNKFIITNFLEKIKQSDYTTYKHYNDCIDAYLTKNKDYHINLFKEAV